MKAFQRDFIEFAIARGVLKFGEFTIGIFGRSCED